MRAKFVPAEMLYPSATQTTPGTTTDAQAPSYGTVDYSAFAQPPTSVAGTAFASQEAGFDSNSKSQTNNNSDFVMPPFDPNQLSDDFNNDPFLKAFSYPSNEQKEKNGSTSKRVPSASTKESPHTSGSFTETSKFGFNYEPLSESINELELASNDKALKEKFEKAKFEIEIGNYSEGNKILKEMMDNKELRYSSSHYFDHNILSTFAPLTDN